MNPTETPDPPAILRLTKRDAGGWTATIDHVEVGWTVNRGNGWSFFCPTEKSYIGTVLDNGAPTRTQAVKNGLSTLAIFHLGRVAVSNPDTHQDEFVFVDTDSLKGLAQ